MTIGVIRYVVSGPEGASVRDDVAYWGDRGLLEHVARFLTLEGVQVTVRFAAMPMHFASAERKAAAAEAREGHAAAGRQLVLRSRLPCPGDLRNEREEKSGEAGFCVAADL